MIPISDSFAPLKGFLHVDTNRFLLFSSSCFPTSGQESLTTKFAGILVNRWDHTTIRWGGVFVSKNGRTREMN